MLFYVILCTYSILDGRKEIQLDGHFFQASNRLAEGKKCYIHTLRSTLSWTFYSIKEMLS